MGVGVTMGITLRSDLLFHRTVQRTKTPPTVLIFTGWSTTRVIEVLRSRRHRVPHSEQSCVQDMLTVPFTLLRELIAWWIISLYYSWTVGLSDVQEREGGGDF